MYKMEHDICKIHSSCFFIKFTIFIQAETNNTLDNFMVDHSPELGLVLQVQQLQHWSVRK